MSQDTMDVVFTILRPQGSLTQEVIESLRTMFGERLIDEIGRMPAYKIAQEIIVRGQTAGFPEAADPVKVASELLVFMRTAQFVQDQPTKGDPRPGTFYGAGQGPRQPTLRELLGQLTDRSSHSEVIPLIEAHELVKKATRKSPNWVITNQDGSINVDATLSYLDHLAKTFTIPRREVAGRRPMPLARALGRDERPLINPFAPDQSRLVITGPIMDDYDLGNLPENVHLAYLWAMVTGHEAWPKVMDPYTHIPEAFAEPLTGRWKRIVDDYEAAKAAGEPTTDGLTRYADSLLGNRSAGGAHPFVSPGTEPGRDENWYRRQLEEAAQSPLRVSASSATVRGLVHSVRVSAGSAHFEGAIVLGDCKISAGSAHGTVYLPRGCSVRVSAGSNNANVRNLSYEKLYALARERDLV